VAWPRTPLPWPGRWVGGRPRYPGHGATAPHPVARTARSGGSPDDAAGAGPRAHRGV